MFVRGRNRRPIEIVDEIPVDVQVIEFAAVDRLEDQVGRGVRRESEVANQTVALQLARRGNASILLQ